MKNAKTVQRISLVLFMIVLLIISNRITNKRDTEEEFTFAFLTDIHVTTERDGDKGLAKAIQDVNEKAPDFVLTGGDQVMDALGASEEAATELYSLYLNLAEGFNMPVHNAVGNHEEFGVYRSSGIEPDHALYSDGMFESMVDKRYRAFDHKGWRFYILDSVEDDEERNYFGSVDTVQLAWIEKDLESVNDSTPIVIVTHIPFLTALSQIRDGGLAAIGKKGAVINSDEVLDLFAGHNLKLVLQGHLHIIEDIYINGIHFLTGGAVCAKWWEGPFNGMEEGYMLIHVKGEEFSWEYVDYGWDVE